MIEKNVRKIISKLLKIFCTLKTRKYFLPMFQNKTKSVENVIHLMIPNGEGLQYLEVINYLLF